MFSTFSLAVKMEAVLLALCWTASRGDSRTMHVRCHPSHRFTELATQRGMGSPDYVSLRHPHPKILVDVGIVLDMPE